MDLTAVNGGALLTGLDAVTLAAGDDVVFLASQVTGLTIGVTGTNAATDLFTVNGATGTVNDTINLSGVSLTTAGVSVAAGAGADTITANAGGGAFNFGTGADTFTAGAGTDAITIGDTDSGITVATADSITGFLSGTDTLTLGLIGDNTANTGNYVEAGAAVADFAAALAAANTGLAVLNSTSAAATLYNFQFDATNGYLFEDTDSDGDADQVIILVGETNATIAHSDIIA